MDTACHLQFAGRLAVALIAVAALFGFPHSFAQVSPRPGVDNALTQILLDLEDVKIHAERIQILSQYCKPPDERNKSAPQHDIDLESLVFRTLLRDFYRVQQISGTSSGTELRASLPTLNGIPPDDARYWGATQGMFTQVQDLLTKKQQQLNDAPERDCAPEQAKQKPVKKDPQSPPDPLAGLTRPKPRDITFPLVPAYFCTEFQRRQWYLDNFASEWNEASENAADASTYRAEVSKRGTEHANKGGDPAQQRRLDAEERWADKNYAQHQRMVQLTESIRLMIMHTPIIDCSLLTQRAVGTTGPLRAEVEQIQNQIKSLDSKIKEKEEQIGILEGQYYFDLDQASRATWSIIPELHQLRMERADLQDWLKHDFQQIDNIQKADAGALTPRVSPEPPKAEETGPSWVPGIFGPGGIIDIIRGGRDGGDRGVSPNPCAGKKK